MEQMNEGGKKIKISPHSTRLETTEGFITAAVASLYRQGGARNFNRAGEIGDLSENLCW